MTTFRPIAALLALLTVLGLAHSAAAAPPTVTFQEVHDEFTLEPTGIVCVGFEILASATVDIRRTRFYDEAGNYLRAIVHVTYVGSLTNSVTGYTVKDTAHQTNFHDIVEDTFRTAGILYQTTVPSLGTVAKDVGVIIFEPDGDVVVRGPHEVFEQGDELLCSVLAGA